MTARRFKRSVHRRLLSRLYNNRWKTEVSEAVVLNQHDDVCRIGNAEDTQRRCSRICRCSLLRRTDRQHPLPLWTSLVCFGASQSLLLVLTCKYVRPAARQKVVTGFDMVNKRTNDGLSSLHHAAFVFCFLAVGLFAFLSLRHPPDWILRD